MSGKGLYSEKGGHVGDGGSDRPARLGLSDVSSLADRPLYLHEDELHRPLSRQVGEDEWAGAADGGDEYELSKHEVLGRLRTIHSPAQLVIDLTEALSIKRPGFDVAVFESQSFRCRAADESIAKVGLILKRVTCVDRRMYDIKVYELDTFMRFMNHPHVVSLYAMWNEPAAGPYAYKTLVGLYREGLRGDLYDYAVARSDDRRLRPRRVKLLACHIAAALRSFHNCNLIHAGIRPKNIYIDEQRNAMVGEVGKVELDSLRYSHHLFSKLFIANAMEHKLAYWAPELLTMQQYGKEVDCWSLGVVVYVMLSGRPPFWSRNQAKLFQMIKSTPVSFPARYCARLRTLHTTLLRPSESPSNNACLLGAARGQLQPTVQGPDHSHARQGPSQAAQRARDSRPSVVRHRTTVLGGDQ